MVSSALQAAQPGGHSQSNVGRLSRPFLGKPWELQLSVGKMVLQTQIRSVGIVKILVMN